MNIIVSRSLVNTCKEMRALYWHEDISDYIIKQKIYSCLEHEDLLRDIDFDEIEWVFIDKKFQGVMIPDLSLVISFSQMQKIGGGVKSRNTYILQNFLPCYKIAQDNGYAIQISMNPFDFDQPINPAQFILYTIKLIKTLGGKIGRSLDYTNGQCFSDLEELLNQKSTLSRTNSGNDPTHIEIDNNNNSINIYGRLDGANKSETVCICSAIVKLIDESEKYNNYSINFIYYSPNNSQANFSDNLKNIILQLGIVIHNNSEIESRIVQEISSPMLHQDDWGDVLSRNQSLFHQNIVQKYLSYGFNVNKCFACNYCVSNNLVASHIYRVADIRRDFLSNRITLEHAAHLIVSGDNGFLLCPNQDREFEKGYIIFDISTKKFILNPNCSVLTDIQKEQIETKINSSDFSNIEFSEEFIENIQKHINRVNNIVTDN